jgi:alpha-L-fucosidase 2
MSGPWLCAHLWEHYQFSKDPIFLREMAYPIMKGSAEFCLSWLIDDGNGGLTTCPSVSTENLFLAKDGKPASVSAGCTLDLNFIRELFDNVVQAADLLNLDVAFASRIRSALQKLPPYKVGSFGQLQEWSEDFAENEPGHRHMSHLYGIYPGAQITPHRQVNFMGPARKSLERRLAHGGGATGWSCLWAICLWARFCDGNMALNSLRKLLQTNTGSNLFNIDFWDKKYLFQIDANLGAAGAIAEMLLQSHDGEVAFLPALPNAWREGSVRGLRARGALEVSMSWKEGTIDSATVRALRGGHHVFCAPKGQQITGVELEPQRQSNKIPFKAGENGRAELEVTADRTYNFHFSRA